MERYSHRQRPFKQNLRVAIGNGKNTSIWYDPWIYLEKPLQPMGPPPFLTKDLKVADLMSSESGVWNREKVIEVLPDYALHILCLRPSETGAEDRFIWLSNQSGTYSTKTGYRIASASDEEVEAPPVDPTFNWLSAIWSEQIPPKIQLFLWRAAQNALPTGENLLNRGLLDNSVCPYFGDLETLEHLFFHCVFAKQVWDHAPSGIPLNPTSFDNFKTVLTTAKRWICLPPTGLCVTPLFPWLCWSLWTSRNNGGF